MVNVDTNAHIELEIPAQERMMMCVRLTTSGVLVRTNLTLDALEDMRLAVEEACNCLMQFAGCATLRLAYDIEERRIVVQVGAQKCCHNKNLPSEDELYTIRCILLSMVDEVQLSGQDEGLTGIQLIKHFENAA